MQDHRSEKRACARFLLILSGLIVLVFFSLRYLGSISVNYMGGFDYQVQRYQREVIHTVNANEKKRDIIVLGDSTAARNMLFSKSYNVVSLATFGGSLIDSYYLLNKYLHFHPPPKCLIIATSYGAFNYHAKELFWPRLVENGFYSLDELNELYQVGLSQNDFPGNMSYLEYGYKVLTSYDWLNGFNWGDLQSYIFATDITLPDNARVYWSVKQSNGFIPIRWEVAKRYNLPLISPAEQHLENTFYPRKTLDIYIRRLFQKIDDLKIRTIILHTPLASGLKSSSSEKWLQDYKQHVNSLVGSHTTIENHIEAEWLDNGNYYDGLHLLSFAAIKYTKSKESLFESCR